MGRKRCTFPESMMLYPSKIVFIKIFTVPLLPLLLPSNSLLLLTRLLRTPHPAHHVPLLLLYHFRQFVLDHRRRIIKILVLKSITKLEFIFPPAVLHSLRFPLPLLWSTSPLPLLCICFWLWGPTQPLIKLWVNLPMLFYISLFF